MSGGEISEALDAAYNMLEGSEAAHDYHRRHGTKSMLVLTIHDDETAALVAERLSSRITGKVVVEIGGGIGLLAMHMADHARHVYVIESDPMWTSTAVAFFYKAKPKNVTFIFGAAEEVAGMICGDVALFCTHSAADHMREVAQCFAPEVIDVYGEIVGVINPAMNELRKLKGTP